MLGQPLTECDHSATRFLKRQMVIEGDFIIFALQFNPSTGLPYLAFKILRPRPLCFSSAKKCCSFYFLMFFCPLRKRLDKLIVFGLQLLPVAFGLFRLFFLLIFEITS